MLKKLTLQNFVIAEELQIDFEAGLCVLTGETGAGKSLIVDAILGVLGQRLTPDTIRQGADFAYLELTFSASPAIQAILREREHRELQDETLLVLSKTIHKTGSRSRLNGELVSQSLVRELGTQLLDSIGQHENQILFQEEAHLSLLDEFGGPAQQNLSATLSQTHQQVQHICRELENLEAQQREQERQRDFIQFQLNEIQEAELRIGEKAELQAERERLRHAEQLIAAVSEVYTGLYDHPDLAVCDQLEGLQRCLSTACRFDPELHNIGEGLENALIQLQDSARGLGTYLETLERDPQALQEIETRLTLIRRLEQKYGEDIPSILNFAESLEAQLEAYNQSDLRRETLLAELQKAENDYAEWADKARQARRQAAKKLEPRIESELRELGMKKIRFQVEFEALESPSAKGLDRIRFLMSPNPGEPLRPLARIASGGEVSRLLLAFKLVLKRQQPVPTLIFDEIDAGISGKTALVVSQKLARLAREHQVLCISHLPVIAAMADQQLWIEKELGQRQTRVQVRILSGEQRVACLAQMGSGLITDSGLEGAREIFAHAHAFKAELPLGLFCA